MEDAVRVDVEGHLDLRHAPRSRWNSGELEFADRAVVARHLTLALQHVDLDRRLVIVRGGKGLALLRWNGRVPRNEHRGHAA